MYTARSRLLEQHPRIGHLLMAMLSQLQVVLRLVIVDLVVHKKLAGSPLSIVRRPSRLARVISPRHHPAASLTALTDRPGAEDLPSCLKGKDL